MMILGIDPGTTHSGIVFYETGTHHVRYSGNWENTSLLSMLRLGYFVAGMKDTFSFDDIFIEDIEAMNLRVGKTVFETAKWIGRFQEAWESHCINYGLFKNVKLVSRGDEKIVLCGTKTFVNPDTGKRKSVSDSQIRSAVIERFPATGGGKTPQIGIKRKPGPLYGMSKHAWSALAVVLTGLQIEKETNNVNPSRNRN